MLLTDASSFFLCLDLQTFIHIRVITRIIAINSTHPITTAERTIQWSSSFMVLFTDDFAGLKNRVVIIKDFTQFEGCALAGYQLCIWNILQWLETNSIPISSQFKLVWKLRYHINIRKIFCCNLLLRNVWVAVATKYVYG